MKESFPYTIEEVTAADSPHLPGMIRWLNQLFPEYIPRFETVLTNQRHEGSRHQPQILVGLCGDQVVGLAQMFYREWQGGLLAYLDLLGVLEPYRRSGLGSALARRAIRAAQERSARYGLSALGLVCLADPGYDPVIRLHRKLGGQIRTDLRYLGGDVVVWYPLSARFSAVETKALAWQLWQFGGLPEAEFVSRYGQAETGSDDETLDVVDRDDRVIGQRSREELYREDSSDFRVVNVFLRNERGQLWIPRRTAHKRIYPLCLDMSVGGHVRSGESYEEAFRREVREELNLDVDCVPWRPLGHLTPYDDQVSAFMTVYEMQTDQTPQYNPDDFVECFWLSPQDVLDQARDGERVKDDLPRLVRIFYIR